MTAPTGVPHTSTHRHADVTGHRMRRGSFLGGQAGGDAEHGQHLAATEGFGGQGQQDRGVDAAGEGDPEASDPSQVGRHAPGRLGQRCNGCGEIGHICHPNRPDAGLAQT